MFTSHRHYARLKSYRLAIGAPWFTDPFDLNLFVFRSGQIGAWDDRVIVACTDDAARPLVESFVATGDAWVGEWKNPTHRDGCIWILNQHVPGGLELGSFKGRPALRQVKPFRYVRWPIGTGRIPMVSDLLALETDGADFAANRGTHIHNRVSGRTPNRPAPNDSEGCTVLLYQHQHAALIQLVEEQRARHRTGIVSPTFALIDDLPAVG